MGCVRRAWDGMRGVDLWEWRVNVGACERSRHVGKCEMKGDGGGM